jgi:hypothetical protein
LTTRQTFGAIDGEQLAPMSGRDPLAAMNPDLRGFDLPCHLPFVFREPFAARWPASGALVLLARGSISGNGTAMKHHEAGGLGDPWTLWSLRIWGAVVRSIRLLRTEARSS